jgi:DNA-binding NarL/FixJ family response regulator
VTAREAAVLDLLSEGLGNEEIAETLGVGTGTIKHHISQASIKLDLHSRVLLASYWSCPLFRLGAGRK